MQKPERGAEEHALVWFCVYSGEFIISGIGALLYLYAASQGIAIPEKADDLFTVIAMSGHLPQIVGVFFVLGLVAAAYSSADSALTSLTTSFSVDILGVTHQSSSRAKRTRLAVHVGFSLVLAVVVLLFNVFNQGSIISTIFNLAGYTYGPLLGLYAFGLFTKRAVRDGWVPLIAILAPLITGLIDYNAVHIFGAPMGFEKLILNGGISFLGLLVLSLSMAAGKQLKSS